MAMFPYDFRSYKNKVIYSPSILFRVFSLCFLVFLLIGFLSVILSGEWTAMGIIPVVVIILLLISLLYRDSWVFDNDSQTITYTYGLGFFVKKESWNYDDIKQIEVTHFIKGIPDSSSNQTPSWKHKRQVVLSIRIDEDTKKDLEIMGEKKSGGKLERNASWLAGFTGLALFVD